MCATLSEYCFAVHKYTHTQNTEYVPGQFWAAAAPNCCGGKCAVVTHFAYVFCLAHDSCNHSLTPIKHDVLLSWYKTGRCLLLWKVIAQCKEVVLPAHTSQLLWHLLMTWMVGTQVTRAMVLTSFTPGLRCQRNLQQISAL